MATPNIIEILSGAATGPISLTTDAGTQVDDLLVCVHSTDFSTVTNMLSPTPGTWTLECTGDGGAGHAHVKVWTRLVTVAGAQSVNTVDPGGSTGSHAALYVLRGADTASYTDAAAADTGAAAATQPSPSITVTNSDDMLICTAQDFNSGVYTQPTGMTLGTTTTGQFSTAASAYLTLSSSGATGTKDWSFTNSANWATASIAFKGAGEPVNEATLTATMPAMTASFNAGVSSEGSIACVLPTMTASFNASVIVSGFVEATLPTMGASFNAAVSSAGTLACVLPTMGCSFNGIVAEPVDGSLSCVLPTMGCVFNASGEAIPIDAPGLVGFDQLGTGFLYFPQDHGGGPCCTELD